MAKKSKFIAADIELTTTDVTDALLAKVTKVLEDRIEEVAKKTVREFLSAGVMVELERIAIKNDKSR